jgi:hypothetical protein
MLSETSGAKAMKLSTVFQWYKWLKEECENVENERSGHPVSHRTDANVEKCGIWCIQIDV